jgi:hypothetical protein
MFLTKGITVRLSTIERGRSPIIGLIHLRIAPRTDVGSLMGLRLRAAASRKYCSACSRKVRPAPSTTRLNRSSELAPDAAITSAALRSSSGWWDAEGNVVRPALRARQMGQYKLRSLPRMACFSANKWIKDSFSRRKRPGNVSDYQIVSAAISAMRGASFKLCL